ncbi:MAG TPA: hypothetical protein PK611_04730 [Saprospiraceae bacterium]|nr:hypothetical protein [Saprospiraceae bacterium]HRO07909.1 hypothetical protein [Saprospiraceae bacterium]HRO72952.1 hypothetical protein [Saprospiraceae bacterium]HRP43090.1 hypothetical protein [Saprospiraceae bacterium]
MTSILVLALSCAKEEKTTYFAKDADYKTEQRSTVVCRPDTSQGVCQIDTITDALVPTFMGCNAVVSCLVKKCETNSIPIQAKSIAIYDVSISFDTNCTVLVDSIEYYVVNGNNSRATYLLNMFNRLATQNIEQIVITNELQMNGMQYNCEDGVLVKLDFFSSKCYKFCLTGKKQVFCGFGCCKRSTAYCYLNDELIKSGTNVTQDSPCISQYDPCERGGNCAADACEILIPVPVPTPGTTI